MVFLFLEPRIPAEESAASTTSQNEVRLTCAVRGFTGRNHCGVMGECVMGRGHSELGLVGQVDI